GACFTQRGELPSPIAKLQVWSSQRRNLEARVHARIEYSAHEECTFDRVRRLSRAEVVLDRVGQRLEQVAILPGTDVEPRGMGLRITPECAGEVPPAAAGADLEHAGPQ